MKENVPFTDALREALKELGYVEGRNVVIDWQYADKAERFAGGDLCCAERVHAQC